MDKENNLPDLGVDFLFGSIEIIKILNDIDDFKAFYNEFIGKKVSNDIFQGYKFAILASLHRVIDDLVSSPNHLDIETDEEIWNAYNWGSNVDSALQNLPRQTSHGILIYNLLILRRKVIGSNTWNELKDNLYDLTDFLLKIDNIFIKCYVGRREGIEQFADPLEVISRKVSEVLLIFMNDGHKLTLSYYQMYRSPKNKTNDIDLKRANRILGKNPFDSFIEFDEIDKQQIFFSGFKIANIFLWKKILGEDLFKKSISIFKELLDSRDWNDFDLLFDKINTEICNVIEKGDVLYDYDLILKNEINIDLKKDLISPIDGKIVTKEHDLKSALLYRPISYVNYDASAAINLVTVLLGLVYAQKINYMQEKAKIVELIHKSNPGNNYSYAIFLPCSGTISDSSRWWLFFRCATDYSGQGGFNHKLIHHFVNTFEKYIEFDKFKVDEDELREYIRSDHLKYLKKQTEEALDINSGMRGALLELLVSSYFWKNGFEVYSRYKPKFLKRELDIVALDKKNKIIYIVECKEKSVTVDMDEFDRLANEMLDKYRKKNKKGHDFGVDHSILTLNQLNEFSSLINKIDNNRTMFLKGLKILENEYKFKGILATTELYEFENKMIPNNIEFWTWWILKEKLGSVNIDKSYFEIIEKHMRSVIARPIRDRSFFKDYF